MDISDSPHGSVILYEVTPQVFETPYGMVAGDPDVQTSLPPWYDAAERKVVVKVPEGGITVSISHGMAPWQVAHLLSFVRSACEETTATIYEEQAG